MRIEAVRKLWSSNSDGAARASRLISAAVPPSSRPAWAADVLAVACTRLSDVPAPVLDVLAIGRAGRGWWRNRWRAAHPAFLAVRALTQAEDRTHAGGQEYLAVLVIAEYAAKVIYNASGVSEPVAQGVPAPFDDDSGAHMVGGLARLARLSASPPFTERAWAVLEAWLRKWPPPEEGAAGQSK